MVSFADHEEECAKRSQNIGVKLWHVKAWAALRMESLMYPFQSMAI